MQFYVEHMYMPMSYYDFGTVFTSVPHSARIIIYCHNFFCAIMCMCVYVQCVHFICLHQKLQTYADRSTRQRFVFFFRSFEVLLAVFFCFFFVSVGIDLNGRYFLSLLFMVYAMSCISSDDEMG